MTTTAIKKIKQDQQQNRNFYFSIDEGGQPTLDSYGFNGKLPEVYIEQWPNPKMTSVSISGMSDMHEHLSSTLQFVASLSDVMGQGRLRLDNNSPISVNEMLDKLGCNENTNSVESTKYLYHGTSFERAKQILANGLQPRDVTQMEANYKTESSGDSLEDRVYMCSEFCIGAAKFAAAQASAKDKSPQVILKIDISELDKSLFAPDEDSRKQTWQESLSTLGSMAYVGSIPKHVISIDKELTPKRPGHNNNERTGPGF